jgi:hypothetical protein
MRNEPTNLCKYLSLCQQKTFALRASSGGPEPILGDLVSTPERDIIRRSTNAKLSRKSCLSLIEFHQKVLAHHKAK